MILLEHDNLTYKLHNRHSAADKDLISNLYTLYAQACEEELKESTTSKWRKLNPEKMEDVKFMFEIMLKNDEEYFFLTVQHENNYVGYFLGFIKHCLGETPEFVGYINGIYVMPQFRRSGVGRCLVDLATQEFTQRGIPAIELYTGINNTAAQEFWKRLGYTVNEISYVKKLF